MHRYFDYNLSIGTVKDSKCVCVCVCASASAQLSAIAHTVR